MAKKKSLKVFISYSHKDMRYKENLKSHLEALKHTYNIDVWHDGKMVAGDDIDENVKKNLEKSDVVLLLISVNFFNSWYCMEVELKEAIERHHAGKCIVVPVIISKCDIDKDMSFSKLTRVPKDGRPIQNFRPHNDGYDQAAKMIKTMIEEKFSQTRKSLNVSSKSDISIPIYQNGKLKPYTLTKETWDVIQEINQKILSFEQILSDKLIDFVINYKSDLEQIKPNSNLKKFRKRKFKSFLSDVSAATREWIFDKIGVRVHFRVLNKNKDKYVGFVVVDGKANKNIVFNWSDAITQMPTSSGMIYHSGHLDAPLIKSLNKKFHEKGSHDDIYVDYITSALKFNDLGKRATPIMSMGISIEKSFNKQYAPYLIALIFFKFDVIVENYITLLCKKIKNIDEGFNITEII